MTIIETIRDIESKQAELAKMIEALKANTPSTYGIPEVLIELNPGEHYAGLVLDAEGEPSHHLILLPGDEENLNWEDAKKWAAKHGGELPSRNEQALLFANLKSQFQPTWYWSSQQHETESSWAWCQYFDDGTPTRYHKLGEFRARAVRRLPI